jgi:hypothetical protein
VAQCTTTGTLDDFDCYTFYFSKFFLKKIGQPKLNKRNKLTDDVSEVCVALKNTKDETNFNDKIEV